MSDYKFDLPQPDVSEGSYGGLRLFFVNGDEVTIEEGPGDRGISDWSTPKGYCYRRGLEDGLETDEDFIQYVYCLWVDRMMGKMHSAQNHLNLMYKYAVKPENV